MAADQVLVNHSQVEVVAEGVNVHGVPDFITLLSEEHGELQQKVVRRSSPGQRDSLTQTGKEGGTLTPNSVSLNTSAKLIWQTALTLNVYLCDQPCMKLFCI